MLAIAKAVCMHQRSNLREPSYNHFLASQLATFLRLSGNQARGFSEFHLSLTNQVTPPTCSRLPRKCTAIIHCQINLHRRPFFLFDQTLFESDMSNMKKVPPGINRHLTTWHCIRDGIVLADFLCQIEQAILHVMICREMKI